MAGSKPGERRGGRKKGTPNKRSVKRAEQRAILEATKTTITEGILPLDYMLSVVRNPDAGPSARERMAAAAAPYIHPRLAHVTSTATVEHRYVARVPDKAPTPEVWQRRQEEEHGTVQ